MSPDTTGSRRGWRPGGRGWSSARGSGREARRRAGGPRRPGSARTRSPWRSWRRRTCRSRRPSRRPSRPGSRASVRELEPGHRADLRLVVGHRVLGVQAHLDRVPPGSSRRARARRAAGRPSADGDLQRDQVDAVDRLGDRVLDLEAGVHLQEVEAVLGRVVEELDGAGAAVVDRPAAARAASCRAVRVASGSAGRGRLLDHLLVAALDRAVALAEDERRRRCPRRTCISTWRRSGRTAPRRRCRRRTPTRASASAACQLARQLRQPGHDPHAAASAASPGLDQERGGQPLPVSTVSRPSTGTPAVSMSRLALHLRTHRLDRLRRGTDPGQAPVDRRPGEGGVLREEP